MTYTLSEIKQTPYQSWLNPTLKRAGKSLKWLSIAVNMDYTSLWKIARGNPDVYPGSSRPEYDNAVKIGEALGDVEGSLKAAGYTTPTTSPEESEFVRAMLSASPEQKALIRGMLRSWGMGIGVEELEDTAPP